MESRRHHNRGRPETRQGDPQRPRIGTSEDRKDKDGARNDESKEESRRGRRQTETKHERDRPRMAGDDANDSQTLTGGDITRYRALVARISYLAQDRPDLKFASMQVCCAMMRPTCATWNASRGSHDTSSGGRERGAGSVGSRVASWKRIRTLTGEVTRPLGDRCRLMPS